MAGFSMSSMLSPKAGMAIVKAALDKTLGTKLENFDIIYKHEEKVIDFRLYNFTDTKKKYHEKVVYKYADGEKLCGIIHTMLKEKLLNGDIIQLAVVNYKNMTCDLYVIRKGEKVQLNYKL